MTTTIDILRRMASATGSPHYGGIDPDTVNENGFSLPGGGMSCETCWMGHGVLIQVNSLGGVMRLGVVVDLDGSPSPSMTGGVLGIVSHLQRYIPHTSELNGVLTTRLFANDHRPYPHTHVWGYRPRDRDMQRLWQWVDVAAGDTNEIPWHGRPEDATDDPLQDALDLYIWERKHYSSHLSGVGNGPIPRPEELVRSLMVRHDMIDDPSRIGPKLAGFYRDAYSRYRRGSPIKESYDPHRPSAELDALLEDLEDHQSWKPTQHV